MNQIKPRTLRILPLLILLALLGLPLMQAQAQNSIYGASIPPVYAQTQPASPITLLAQPAFDGYFKYGEWLPVWVTLENQGADVNGELSISVSGSGGTMIFAAPVELPAGARKRLPVYVLPNNFSRSLQVQYTSNSGEVLVTQKVSGLQPQINSTYFIGLVTPQRGALSQLNGLSIPGLARKIFLIDLTLEQIPPRFESLRSLDVIIFNGLDTSSLSAEQTQALDLWVRQGGRLVIGGGALALETASGLTGLDLPLQPTQVIETAVLDGLAAFPAGEQPALSPGAYLLAQGETAADARILAGTSAQPLVLESTREKGRINSIALDLATAPFEGWSGTLAFWEALITPGASYPSWLSPDVSNRQQAASQMSYALQNLPMLDLPSVKSLALLLGLYILVIGPLNYFVLRKQNRLHWAWITIPVITLIFSLSAFGLAYAMHGSDLFVNKISVIESGPDGQAAFTSYIGLFSPAQSGYEIEVPGGGLLSPLAPYYNPWDSFGTDAGVNSGRSVRLVQTDPAYIQGLTVDQWSMQSFMVEGLQIDFSGLSSDLVVADNRLSGAITNQSSYTLKDVSIVFSSRFQRLGDLAPGASLDVTLDLSAMGMPNFGAPVSYQLYEAELNNPVSGRPPRDVEVKRAILEALFNYGSPVKSAQPALTGNNASLLQSPVFLGWLENAPPEVRISGAAPAQQSTSLVYSLLPYTVKQDAAISLPVGLLPGNLAKMPLEGGYCGMSGTTAVYIYRGEAEFEFFLPPELLGMQVEQLKLGIWSDTGIAVPPQTDIYQWEGETWLTLQDLVTDVNLIPDAAGLVNENGQVRIRMTGDSTSQGCFYLGLGLDGQPAGQ